MIKTQGLTKKFKIGKKGETELVAVDGLSLEVERGEVFGFLGPNGAGKTTTVRMLTGLIRPTTGSAQIAGFELGKNDTEIRRNRLGDGVRVSGDHDDGDAAVVQCPHGIV